MKQERVQTLCFKSRPHLRARASIVGPKEGQGPLCSYFDRVTPDDLLGQKSWELAESEMLRQTIELLAEKGGLTVEEIDVLLAGDLLNQIMSSSLSARALGRPFFGLYGACSTAIEALILGGALIDGGYFDRVACAASSHFCTAERQFRFPLALGTQRPPSAHWTATAAGALLLDASLGGEPGARLTHGTIGRVVDYQIDDANHMGAAMAPAVCDTIMHHFQDLNRSFADYDLIATGDLGYIGRNLLAELLRRRGVKVDDEKLIDCGATIFSQEQDPHAGGSGCGCVASVLSGYLLERLRRGEIKRLLVIGSGAMLSSTSQQQGQSIPGIAYAAAIEREE